MNTKSRIVAAFQSWNGRTNEVQTSGLYLKSEMDVEQFIEDHYNSDTFATLHTFEDERTALTWYNDLQEGRAEVINYGQIVRTN